jgi:hypothetical protein
MENRFGFGSIRFRSMQLICTLRGCGHGRDRILLIDTQDKSIWPHANSVAGRDGLTKNVVAGASANR